MQALGATNGGAAASLAVAEKYIGAFGELAKTSTTVLLPANTGDVGSMVAQVNNDLLLVNTWDLTRILASHCIG